MTVRSGYHRTGRTRLGAVVCAAALGLLTACGGTDAAGTVSASTATSGPWEFTDDQGVKISKPKRPSVIVAESGTAGALWEYGVKAKGIFGQHRKADGSKDPLVGDVDLASVEVLGNAWGEFNLEKFAALKPDIVLTTMQGPMLWAVPQESKDKINAIAPIGGIQLAGKPLPDVITQMEGLAKSLGGNADSDPIKKARADLATAENAVREAVKAKPGLKVLVANASKEGLSVAPPKYHGDLRYFASLGVELVGPNSPDQPFETLSWEQAGKYPADVVLLDNREGTSTPAELKAIPTWNTHPAVKAGQVGVWHTLAPIGYRSHAEVLTDLAGTVRKSRTDVVN
jgi:iron complex transport system substrate-binding protein